MAAAIQPLHARWHSTESSNNKLVTFVTRLRAILYTEKHGREVRAFVIGERNGNKEEYKARP